MNITYFHETVLQQMFGNLTGLIGLSIHPLKKQDWTEVSWRNNVCTAKLNVKPRLELHVVNKRKLTLFSLGNSD